MKKFKELILIFRLCYLIKHNSETLYRRIDKVHKLLIENFTTWNHRYLRHLCSINKISFKNSSQNIQESFVSFLKIVNFARACYLVFGVCNSYLARKLWNLPFCFSLQSARQQCFPGHFIIHALISQVSAQCYFIVYFQTMKIHED